MVYDIHHDGFLTFDEFIDYAEGASNGPASVFVHLCCLDKLQGEYVPPKLVISDVARPCAMFSYLVHIVRDFQKDQNNNLNYFPLDILQKNGLKPDDLKIIANSEDIPPGFREVVREYKSRAAVYMEETRVMLESLRNKLEPRYYLSLRIIFHLYKQIFDRIDPENGSFSSVELNPTPEEIRQKVQEVIREYFSQKVTEVYTERH